MATDANLTRPPVPASRARRSGRWKRLLACALAGLWIVTASDTGALPRIDERKGIVELATSYHAPSDTYFKLIQDWKTTQGVTWAEARRRAEQLTHRGRPGRLAVIRDPELYGWILSALPLPSVQWGGGATWIGLRYWCGARQLLWVDMKPHRRRQLAPWAVPWNRNGDDICNNAGVSYMGVYHLGQIGRWQAVGPAKRFPHYIVEYAPVDDTAVGDSTADDQSAAAGAERP